ncbi:MAG TPA: shikimate dehydrogenase [Clostridia bacterium]|nr:shikimate dehydrogenase [Clostridia bacterium]
MNDSPTTYARRLLPIRLPRVCVAVTGSDINEMVEKAESLVRDNPLIEFRLDYLKNPATAYQRLRRLFEYRPDAIAIATCRRAVNGGKFRGSVAAQLEILTKAAAAGCQMVDVELETAAALKPAEIEKLRSRASLILSHHDFRATRKIDETFDRMKQFPADFFKVVTTATSLYDNVLMMKFLQQNGDRHSLIGLCMGEQGIISRVLGLRAGSAFTFVAASAGEETAPGQITARELRDTYRIEQVDAATRVYGVAGDPVSQSLSPVMMNAAFRRENVNAVYLSLHAKSLDDLLRCVRDIPIHGLSITMPYKQAIVEHLDNSDPLTQKVGACNTVVRSQDGKIYGFNTDVAGIISPLEQRIALSGARVLVIGAGGAARAAVFALRSRNAEVFILNRTAANAQKLARQAHAKTVKRADIKKLSFDIIINATPLGMGANKQSPLDEKEIRAKYVFDLVYNPAETRLMKMARAQGLHVIGGIEMFANQGARQFEIWTGKPSPKDEMRYVVSRALEDRAASEEKTNGKPAAKAATKAVARTANKTVQRKK